MSQVSKAPRCAPSNSPAVIGNAMFWAAMILLVAKFAVPAGGSRMTLTGILIACWFAVHQMIPRR